MNSGQLVLHGLLDDTTSLHAKHRIDGDNHAVNSLLDHGWEGSVEVIDLRCLKDLYFDVQRTCSGLGIEQHLPECCFAEGSRGPHDTHPAECRHNLP